MQSQEQIFELEKRALQQYQSLERIVGSGDSLMKLPCLYFLATANLLRQDMISGRQYIDLAQKVLNGAKGAIYDLVSLVGYATIQANIDFHFI